MAFGAKTNERPGTRAQARHVRTSAYKAREVLDLIRGEPCGRALEILQFSERDIAHTIQKVVESAMANAEHNDGIPQDELYVSACFADEGPTLKRWRPRARGRATRIRKRTCHITVIVSRFSAEELDRQRAAEAAGGGGSNRSAVEARRRRVQRSREAAAARAEAEAHDHDHDHEHDHEHDHDHEAPAVTDVADEVAADAPDAEAPAAAADTDDTTSEEH